MITLKTSSLATGWLTLVLAAPCVFAQSAGISKTDPAKDIPATATNAVEAVTKLFTPNPVVLVEGTKKPLSTSGDWSVAGKLSGAIPAACTPEVACFKVIYRVPENNIACSWIVAFLNNTFTAKKHEPIKNMHPVIIAEDDNAAHYLLKKSSSPEEPYPHIVKHVDPDYPPIALAGHVSGTVSLQIIVDSEGEVQQVAVFSGPPMLQGAAADAVRQWKFDPVFVGDHRTSFQMRVEVGFNQ